MTYGAHFPSEVERKTPKCCPLSLVTVVAGRITLLSLGLVSTVASSFGWNVQEPTLDWARFIENKNNEILRLNGECSSS
jgi:hypothetical protein